MIQPREDLLNREEAAAYLRVSTLWLARHTPGRGGPDYVKLGRTPFYRRSTLDAWIASQETATCQGQKPETRPPSRSTTVTTTAPAPGGSTSGMAENATESQLAREIAARLRMPRGRSARTASPKLVALGGGKAPTSPFSEGSMSREP